MEEIDPRFAQGLNLRLRDQLDDHAPYYAFLTGVTVDPAEMVIVTPQGAGRFAVIGRLTAHGP